MTGERLDPDVLDAFLENRLAADERARVLRILVRSPEMYREFLDAVEGAPWSEGESAAQWDEDERAIDAVGRLDHLPWWRTAEARWGMMAIVLAVLAVGLVYLFGG